MDFKNLKTWMPAAGFDKNGNFYRDVHFKKGKIEYGSRDSVEWEEETREFYENGYDSSRPVCKANGRVVGVVFIRRFDSPEAEYFNDRDQSSFRFCAVAYSYAIPNGERGYVPDEKGTYLAFFESMDDAWVAMCDAATEMEHDIRADMEAGRANKYFTTEHLNATYYPFSGESKHPDDNGGFYDPATPLFNEQVLPATTS